MKAFSDVDTIAAIAEREMFSDRSDHMETGHSPPIVATANIQEKNTSGRSLQPNEIYLSRRRRLRLLR